MYATADAVVPPTGAPVKDNTGTVEYPVPPAVSYTHLTLPTILLV